MDRHRVFKMSFAGVYPYYIQKAGRKGRTMFRTALAGFLLALTAAPVMGQTGSIVGEWHGTSICVDRQHFPACKDEQVVYEARVSATSPDTVVVRADKVVNGERDFMGEYPVALQEDGSWASEMKTARFHLLLKLQVAGDRMTGTLTDLGVGYRVRDITLERAE